jgi:tetratricopeptide (TPR) repeat protein
VHEEKARLLCKHVAVQCRDSNVVFFECGDHRINFLRPQHEIPGCRNFARAGFLEIDRLGYALRRGQCHSVIADRPSTRNPEGKHTPDKAALRAQRVFDCLAFGWSALRSLRSGKYLYARAPRPELYDESQDTNAQKNLTSSSPAVADTLLSQLNDLHDKTSSYHGDKAESTLTAEQSEKLAALGYAGSSSAAVSADSLQSADPKDKIEISNILHTGMIAVEDGRYAEAIPLLQHVLDDSPKITAAQAQLGIALARVKRYPEAIIALKKAVILLPDSVQPQYELGLALYETGEWKESVPYFESVAKKRPKWPDAQYSLASVYARTQHVPEAVDLLHIVLELNPEHFRANLLLGRILTLQHRPEEAQPYLKKAASLEPDNFEPHAFLADNLDQLGDSLSAATERDRAQVLKRVVKP